LRRIKIIIITQLTVLYESDENGTIEGRNRKGDEES